MCLSLLWIHMVSQAGTANYRPTPLPIPSYSFHSMKQYCTPSSNGHFVFLDKKLWPTLCSFRKYPHLTPPMEGFFGLLSPTPLKFQFGFILWIHTLFFGFILLETPSPSKCPMNFFGATVSIWYVQPVACVLLDLISRLFLWKKIGTIIMLDGRRQFREPWNGKWMTTKTKVQNRQ